MTVDNGARMDLGVLEQHLQGCLDNQKPVYAVVAIVGSTEEGSVDPLKGVVELRDKFQAQGLSFLIHGDGAWGGYFCTMCLRGLSLVRMYPYPQKEAPDQGLFPMRHFVPKPKKIYLC